MAISEGKISEENFDEEVSKIPRFHAHACRKYFISTISDNCGDLRLCTLMEGHQTPIITDPSYVKKDFDGVKGAYLQAHDDLTLAKVKTKIYTNKMTQEIDEKVDKDLKAKDETIDALKKELKQLKKDRKIKEDSEIENIVNWYFTLNLQIGDKISNDERVLCTYAIEEAKEDKVNFDASEEYLESLFNKAKARMLMNPQDFDGKLNKSYELLSKIEITQNLNLMIWKVTTNIFNNAKIKSMLSDKEKILKLKIIEYLDKYKCQTLDDLTDEVLKIVSENAVADVL